MRGKQNHSRERNLRRAQTDAEARLWRHLRDRRLASYKFRRQHRIGAYFVDLVCAEAKLIVELDGGQHAERKSYDAARTVALEAAGYRVIRFWNDDVLERTEVVLEEILCALNERDPRRCRLTPHPSTLSPLAGRGSSPQFSQRRTSGMLNYVDSPLTPALSPLARRGSKAALVRAWRAWEERIFRVASQVSFDVAQ